MCQLDPQVERPELRAFARHPLAEAKARRGELVVAALTILRAYHVAGRPCAPTPLGSFEDWSDWVRGSLLWLGCADPISTMESVRQQDPRLDALTAVLAQWHEHLSGSEVSARGIIACATAQFTAPGGSLNFPKLDFRRPDFREALLIVVGDNGSINSKRLGRWIAAHEGRLINGRRITRGGVITGVQQWRLVPQVEPGGGDAT
jgi:hypothetical protein